MLNPPDLSDEPLPNRFVKGIRFTIFKCVQTKTTRTFEHR